MICPNTAPHLQNGDTHLTPVSPRVDASTLSDLQPEDQPSPLVEASGWSQTKAARRKQRAKKRNKQLLVKDAIAIDSSDFDDLSDIAATDDEQPPEETTSLQALPKQHLQQTPAKQHDVTASADVADQVTVQKGSFSGSTGRPRTRASRFNNKKRLVLHADMDVSPASQDNGYGAQRRYQAPASPKIKAVQPDPEFMALVSLRAF